MLTACVGTVVVGGGKEGIEMVRRPLMATYSLRSDLQLWRAGLNDHGNAFSHLFSSVIGKYCVSRQCMNPRTAISPAQMLLFRTCVLSKTMS